MNEHNGQEPEVVEGEVDETVITEAGGLPELPRYVTGWDVAVVETPAGDKALLLIVRSDRGDVVLGMGPQRVGQLAQQLVEAVVGEF